MIPQSKNSFLELKKIISKERKIISEFKSLKESEQGNSASEKEFVNLQITSLKNLMGEQIKKLEGALGELTLKNPLQTVAFEKQEKKAIPSFRAENKLTRKIAWNPFENMNNEKFSYLEKQTVRRVEKREKKVLELKEKKPSAYIKLANYLFSERSELLVEKEIFRNLKRNLTKANIQFVPKTYLSMMMLTILISIVASFVITAFFLFFNISSELPMISLVSEDLSVRFLKFFWILFLPPIFTFFGVYFYPSLEKKSNQGKINAELPFAAIHMSAISSSLTDPTRIFSIIISTNEYPYISREFTKLLNQINLSGSDLVSSLRFLSFNTSSSKFSDLLNGLSTTINSGGDISKFFEKRAESLLFDYKIEREKQTKSVETFMDIYISAVIAAPMMLMLLVMMMKISGLGISLSSKAISLIMVLGVSLLNVVFLVFLHLKKS